MKKFIIFTSLVFIAQAVYLSVNSADFNSCKRLYTDGEYNSASKCFYYRLQSDSSDVQSRFWYAASLFFDRQYYQAYAQYNFIAQKYPNSNIGRYSKNEAQKVKAKIDYIKKAESIDKGNYVKDLEFTSKWTQMPVKVWIQPCIYKNTAEKAFLEWQTKSDSTVRFSFVSNPNSAKIKVHFVDSLNGAEAQKELGSTILKYSKGKIYSAEIKILQRTQSKQLRSQKQIYSVILHEAGHALGLSGHSKSNNDIMFENDYTNDVHLSKRDINTLKAIYNSK